MGRSMLIDVSLLLPTTGQPLANAEAQMNTRRAPGPRTPAAARRRRLALYSHDTQGLGHIRRNIALAASLVASDPATDVLLLTGAPEATSLPLPPNTDIVTLPTLCKDETGRYAGRRLSAPLPELLALRSSILEAILTAFGPDLLIVDKVARGVHGELDAALRALRDTGTRVVLGLREVLDTPSVVRREWAAAGTSEAVRDFYDAVWIYGDREVYDTVVESGLPPVVAAKVAYTGYLGYGRNEGTSARPGSAPPVHVGPEPYVLCLVGGGQDGQSLADAFVRTPLPADHRGVVLTGPYMRRQTREALRQAASDRVGTTVLEFVPGADRWIAGAAAVVSMAGYNSVCELLVANRRTLLVPRAAPRAEQMLRARSLERRGLVDVLDPEVVDPGRLGRWLAGAVVAGPPTGRGVDLDGLLRVRVLSRALLSRAPHDCAQPWGCHRVAV